MSVNQRSKKANSLRANRGGTRKSGQQRSMKGTESTVAVIPKLGSPRVIFFKDIVPPRLVSRLKYLVQRPLSNPTLNVASIQLRANGVYDVDPAVASTAIPGFTEFMALYDRYRVLKAKSKCTFCNRENFPVLINLGFDTNFFGSNLKNLAYFEGSAQKTQIAGANSVVPVILSIERKGMDVVGDEAMMTSIGYTGTASTNPSSLWYVSAAVDCSNLGAAFTGAGVAVRWETEFEVEFFERKNVFA